MAAGPDKRPQFDRGPWTGAFLVWLTTLNPRVMLVGVFGVVLFGTIGYMIVGDLGMVDALYMAMITISTVGYGDLTDTDAGRLFSVIYLCMGVTVFTVTISTLGAALVAGRVQEVLGRRRMERQISELSEHLILCGFGRFGQITAGEIFEKAPLVVIDIEQKVVDEADERDFLALLADATEEESLMKAGIERARALLCTLPTDAENVYTILNARELNPKIPIVALARDRRAESKLIRAGANYVVSPYSIGATHMARQILSPHLAQVFSLAAAAAGEDGLTQVGVELDEYVVGPGSSLIGMALKDSPIRKEFQVMLVAVIAPGGERIFNPGPDIVMQEGSVLVSIGPPEGLDRLRDASAGPMTRRT